MLVPNIKRALTAVVGTMAMVAATSATADYALNLTRGVTPISQEAHAIHMLILWVCVAIGIVVFGVMFISIIFHRKSRGAKPAQFHESTAVEIAWTIVPFLILIGMAIPATKALVVMEDTSDADISIKVTGYQWRWGYDYMEDDVSFISALATPKEEIYNHEPKGEHYLLEVDKPVVVPVNKKVRLLITSNDVIHAWWVPELGMKKDAIPGYINEMWFKADKEGIYRGQCAELCGKDHGFMPIVVDVRSEADYRQWIAQQQGAVAAEQNAAQRDWTKDELMAQGEKVYASTCAACHQANGEGIPGTFPPLKGGAIATGPKADHLSLVLHGKAGTAMMSFAGQLSDTDLAAVVTYERNSWGNNTGDLVQPSEVKEAR